MIRLLPLLLLFLTTSLLAQDDVQSDFVLVIRSAIRTQKLPTELISRADTLFIKQIGTHYVAVQATAENALHKYYDVSGEQVKVHIWPTEDLMNNHAKYWIVPKLIEKNDNRLSFEYVTVATPLKEEDIRLKCYAGKLSASQRDGQWTVNKSSFKQVGCRFKRVD